MAETMGVGGLTGHLLVSTVVGGGLHVADEAIGANVVADADRAAKGIAKQLSAMFAREGWTSGAAPGWKPSAASASEDPQAELRPQATGRAVQFKHDFLYTEPAKRW
jgi:hypothetical protein